MGMGIREREKASIRAPCSCLRKWKCPQAESSLLLGTATDEGQIKTWADGLIY